MTKFINFQIRKRIPIISILLIISCLISTIPQFYLDSTYSFITSQRATLKSFYLITLNSFTHSPEYLINHLIGNLLVLLIFGIITEIIIGSKKFATISLITFFLTKLVNYLHFSRIIGHGASGIVWGYHTFFIYFIIVLYKQNGKKIFKDRFIILALIILLFNIFGIPILEVIVLKKQFFENFGQIIHIISMISVTPFVYFWRRDIKNNIDDLVTLKPIRNLNNAYNISIILMLILNYS